MTVRDAAKALEVSESTIYQLCASGRLPHYRIGVGSVKCHIRIDPKQLEAFKASCLKGSPPPPPPAGRSVAADLEEIRRLRDPMGGGR